MKWAMRVSACDTEFELWVRIKIQNHCYDTAEN